MTAPFALPPRFVADLGTAPDHAVATRHQVSRCFVWAHRRRRSIAPYRTHTAPRPTPGLDAWAALVAQHPGSTGAALARLRGVSREAARQALETLATQGRVWGTAVVGNPKAGRRWYAGEGKA